MSSHTELSTFRRCAREHHYKYVRRVEPLIPATALLVGRKLDTAIKNVLRGRVELDRLLPAERALVKGYMVRWKNSFKVEEVDVRFKIRIGGVDINGEIDMIGLYEGRRTLLELKSTSEDIGVGSGYWRRVTQVDPQATIYLKAAKELGLGEPFLLWDAVRKPALRQGKKETDQEFENRVLTDISENLDYYYRRAQVVRSDEEHEQSESDIAGTGHLMQVARMLSEAPRNVDACFHFHRPCEFFDVCSGAVSLDDPTRFVSKNNKNNKPAAVQPRFEF